MAYFQLLPLLQDLHPAEWLLHTPLIDCVAKNQNWLAWPPLPVRLYRIHSTRTITFSVGTLMLSLAFTTWNIAYFYSTALFLLLAPKSHKIKASSNIDELQDSGSHNAFGICRLIRLKNKWLGFFGQSTESSAEMRHWLMRLIMIILQQWPSACSKGKQDLVFMSTA